MISREYEVSATVLWKVPLEVEGEYSLLQASVVGRKSGSKTSLCVLTTTDYDLSICGNHVPIDHKERKKIEGARFSGTAVRRDFFHTSGTSVVDNKSPLEGGAQMDRS